LHLDKKMRLDLFLKASRLVPRRSIAQQFCDAGRVRLNGAGAKSSKEVKAGDEVEIRRGNRRTCVRILTVPTGKQVSKAAAAELFEIISDETLADELL
jgi:ribosomal 50S subunit-recycling heat shock protein